MIPFFLIVLLVGVAIVAFVVNFVLKRLLYVAEPNEALVFVGARHPLANRSSVGYRLVRGGRGVRKPLLETVSRIDLTMFTIDVAVHNAYSRGGIPLSVVGVANVKVAGEEPLIHNAIERFLGKQRAELMRIAKETLEGNLRGVLAQLTPEEVNEDKVRFAQTLIEEAEHDMSRMGLSLQTLKIQNVSDEVGYLNSIGRVRGALVKREAAIAEARAHAEAAVRKTETTSAAELKKIDVDLQIAREEARKRSTDLVSRREALIAEAQANVAAQVAQVRAEIERQKARVVQTQQQLLADVVEPAEAASRVAEEQARGAASAVVERARAQALALGAVVAEMRQAGPAGREVLALQKLLPMASSVAGAAHPVAAERLVMLPREEGSAARKVISTTEQLRSALGVNIVDVVKRIGAASPPARGTDE